jgi:CMP-N-acetylneuraminic acid synthetase
MKTVAFIPIKLNSERLPSKNVKAFKNGKPLIHYILETATITSSIDELYVYCSSEKIINYLPSTVKYLKRPECLDLSTTSITEVITSFTETIQADTYVLLHATAPFIKAESINKGILAVSDGTFDSAFPVTVNHEFLWIDGKPNYNVKNIPRTQDLEPFYIETTGFYIFTSELAKQKRRIGDRPFFIEVSKIEATDINDPVDFEIADAIYNYIVKRDEIVL